MNAPGERKSVLASAMVGVSSAIKIAGLVGTVSGFTYLLVYANSVGIPFPLELSVLPSMLLLVGAVALVCTLCLSGAILMPAFLADDPFGVTKDYFLALDSGVKMEATRLKRYFLCTWVPIALMLMAFLVRMDAIGTAYWTRSIAIALAGGAALWITATALHVEAFHDTKLRFVLTMVVQVLCSVFAYSVLLLMIIAVYPEMETWPAWRSCLLVLATFTPIHLFISIPQSKGRNVRILLAPTFKHETLPASAIMFGAATILTVWTMVAYPLNAKVGRTVLLAFGAGGGIPAIICLKSPPPSPVTSRIPFDKDGCSSRLYILFDVGDRIYVAKHAGVPATTKDDPSAISLPIFFRQEDITAKIYLPKTKT